MTTQAGWYPDPQTPHLSRWWDGQAWTAHTSAPPTFTPAPPTMPSVADPYAFALPTPPSRRGPVIGVIVIVVLVVVGVVAAIPVAMKKQAQKGPPNCGTFATAGMSSQAKAYVDVVHDFYRRSEAYTKQVNAEGGSAHLSTQSDYLAEIGIETAFVTGVESIPFTGPAARDAQQVEAESEQTIRDLNLALTQPGPDVDARLTSDYANESAASLRTDLGLTPRGTCSFWQPE